MIATKSAGHMQVGGWISRWSRGPLVCPICPLHLLFPLGAIPGHQGKMSRKIRFYFVFSTLGFWTGEFPQPFHKNPLLQKKKVPTRKGGGQNSGNLLSPPPSRTSRRRAFELSEAKNSKRIIKLGLPIEERSCRGGAAVIGRAHRAIIGDLGRRRLQDA